MSNGYRASAEEAEDVLEIDGDGGVMAAHLCECT